MLSCFEVYIRDAAPAFGLEEDNITFKNIIMGRDSIVGESPDYTRELYVPVFSEPS